MQKSTAVAINALADVFAYERLLDREQLQKDSDLPTKRTHVQQHSFPRATRRKRVENIKVYA